MSQSGLLSEDEVRTYINEGFSLKIDRDSFIKPTKDFVYDIYARFLDYFSLPWNKPNPSIDYCDAGPNLKVRMVGNIRFILSKYNTTFEFNMNDLLTPTRKRTTVFMNILIYIKAQVDEAWANWQAAKEERIGCQQEVEKIKGENNQLKLEIEDMAIAKSSYDIEELKKKIAEKRRHFESIRGEGEALSARSKDIKKKNLEDTEQLKKEQIELETLIKREEEIMGTLRLLNDGRKLRKNIQELKDSNKRDSEQLDTLKENCRKEKILNDDLERVLVLQESSKHDIPKQTESFKELISRANEERDHIKAQLDRANEEQKRWVQREAELQVRVEELMKAKNRMSMQHKIRLEQSKSAFDKEIEVMEERYKEKVAQLNQLKDELKNIKAKRAEIVTRQAATFEQSKALIEKSNLKLEPLRKQIQDFKAATQRALPEFIAAQRKIDLLIGKPKEIELPANRMYNKSTDQIYDKVTDQIYNKDSNATYNKDYNASYNKGSNATYNKDSNATYNKDSNQTYNKSSDQIYNKASNQTYVDGSNATYIKETGRTN